MKDIGDLSRLIEKNVAELLEEEIMENHIRGRELTLKSNWVAIITNGTAILGFGDIGAIAGMPVMEVHTFFLLIIISIIRIIRCPKSANQLSICSTGGGGVLEMN